MPSPRASSPRPAPTMAARDRSHSAKYSMTIAVKNRSVADRCLTIPAGVSREAGTAG